ncbi:CD209 antigen-like protein A isoform X2 [Siniperca chuatsi]|uniref:CD209 antigen-like protein A isoform X2 n=1 Tax=Siniperca chuatsi TaxID=119488 RepID=UPI001CE0B77B|nr:CD209 antigen-like protein A isoform X2 [Siniperca chuatsi]
MEERENYTSLQDFTEQLTPGGNRPILEHSNDSQVLKRGVECLRSPTALLMVIGFLASICANIVLAVLLIGRLVPGAHLDSSSLGLKLTSVQRRYIQLCEDYTALGQSCSKTVKQCKECPEGWLHVGDQCYHFSSDKLDWLKSRDSCAEMGSHLTILHTMEQHDALEKEARRIGGFDYHFWIGLSDIEKEGDWRWVDNTTLQHKFQKVSSMNQGLGRGEYLSEMFSYLLLTLSNPLSSSLSLCHRYWDQWSSEPDNHQSGGEHGEDCATLNSHSKTWFDVPCDHIYKRICQMEAIQPN